MIEIAKLPADDRRDCFTTLQQKPDFTMPLWKGFLGMFDIGLSVPPFPVEKGGHI